ncbi:hypothetical protein CQ011_16250 [Arthrobacter sp. MYb213]|nr:hypothetical protein CQ011_16250 [Arthrobacter sp. MYb213]
MRRLTLTIVPDATTHRLEILITNLALMLSAGRLGTMASEAVVSRFMVRIKSMPEVIRFWFKPPRKNRALLGVTNAGMASLATHLSFFENSSAIWSEI